MPTRPKRHPFTLAVCLLTLLILVGYGLDTALHAQSWAGQLGGELGIVGALLLLLVLWRKRSTSPMSMFFIPYLLMKSWARIDSAAAAGALTGIDFIWPALLSLGAVALVVWILMRSGSASPWTEF